MTDEYENPRTVRALQHLMARLLTLREPKITVGVIRNMVACVKQHRNECKRKGVPFPELTPFVLPRQNVVEFVRRDLDDKAIGILLKNYTVMFPDITPRELGAGLIGAFPERRSSHHQIEVARPQLAAAH